MSEGTQIVNQKSKIKNTYAFLIKLCIGIALIAWLINKVGPGELLGKLKQVSVFYYLISLAVYAGGEGLRTIRWKWLLRAVGREFRMARLVSIQFIGAFFNQFLPTSVGGDGARVFYLCKDEVPWDKAVASVLVERIIGMLMLLLLGLIAGVVGFSVYRDVRILGALLAFAAAFGAGTVFLFSARAFGLLLTVVDAIGLKRMRPDLERFSQAVRVYRSHPKLILAVAAVSIAFQATLILLFYFFGRQIGMEAHIGYFFLFIPIIISVSLVPISPGGLGVRDWTSVLLFTQVGADESQAFALTMFYWLLTIGTALLGGLAFIASGEKQPEEEGEGEGGEKQGDKGTRGQGE